MKAQRPGPGGGNSGAEPVGSGPQRQRHQTCKQSRSRAACSNAQAATALLQAPTPYWLQQHRLPTCPGDASYRLQDQVVERVPGSQHKAGIGAEVGGSAGGAGWQLWQGNKVWRVGQPHCGVEEQVLLRHCRQ